MIAFTHKRLLTPGWTPGPGQRHADAPKAECRVTRMTKLAVYYTYASAPTNRGAFCMTRETWDREYAAPQEQA